MKSPRATLSICPGSLKVPIGPNHEVEISIQPLKRGRCRLSGEVGSCDHRIFTASGVLGSRTERRNEHPHLRVATEMANPGAEATPSLEGRSTNTISTKQPTQVLRNPGSKNASPAHGSFGLRGEFSPDNQLCSICSCFSLHQIHGPSLARFQALGRSSG